jgi:hypothetical protein
VRRKGPKWDDIKPGSNRIEERQIDGYRRRDSRPGKSRIEIKCPFCQIYLWAYVWSLSGGGKRCDCGALIGGSGNVYHFIDRSQT